MTKISGIRAGILSIGALLAAGAAQADAVKLKAASFLPARATVAKPFHRWVGEVNKRCKGKVHISVVGPAAIGSLEQWNALKNGVVDMHYGPANYYKGTMPAAAVTDVAHVPVAEQRKNGAWAMLNELYHKKMNAWYLTYLIDDVRFYVWTSKPAKNGRFDGQRIRSTPIYDEFLKSLGAVPVRMAPPAVYTGLERGTVTGYGWPDWGITDFGWQKYTKYQYGPGFFNAAVQIIVNLDKWKSMSGAQRSCLSGSAVWLEKVWPTWLAQEDRNQQAILKKSGIKYGKLDATVMKQVENAYWEELAKANPGFIKTVRPLLRKVVTRQSPPHSPCGGSRWASATLTGLRPCHP